MSPGLALNSIDDAFIGGHALINTRSTTITIGSSQTVKGVYCTDYFTVDRTGTYIINVIHFAGHPFDDAEERRLRALPGKELHRLVRTPVSQKPQPDDIWIIHHAAHPKGGWIIQGHQLNSKGKPQTPRLGLVGTGDVSVAGSTDSVGPPARSVHT